MKHTISYNIIEKFRSIVQLFPTNISRTNCRFISEFQKRPIHFDFAKRRQMNIHTVVLITTNRFLKIPPRTHNSDSDRTIAINLFEPIKTRNKLQYTLHTLILRPRGANKSQFERWEMRGKIPAGISSRSSRQLF